MKSKDTDTFLPMRPTLPEIFIVITSYLCKLNWGQAEHISYLTTLHMHFLLNYVIFQRPSGKIKIYFYM